MAQAYNPSTREDEAKMTSCSNTKNTSMKVTKAMGIYKTLLGFAMFTVALPRGANSSAQGKLSYTKGHGFHLDSGHSEPFQLR